MFLNCRLFKVYSFHKKIYSFKYLFSGTLLSSWSWEKRLCSIRIWSCFLYFWVDCFLGQSNYWCKYEQNGHEIHPEFRYRNSWRHLHFVWSTWSNWKCQNIFGFIIYPKNYWSMWKFRLSYWKFQVSIEFIFDT